VPKLLQNLKAFYAVSRRDLPWRRTHDPYKILISEVMLQQTQVERVLPFYERFIKEFPTVEVLAKASLQDVLSLWSGLGYNRRGKYLHEAAKAVMQKHRGKFPRKVQEIEALPGVGHYTARAVAAFAYNAPETFVETNIRTVFIHFCFARKKKRSILITDHEILTLVKKTLTASRMEPRDFYAALMDYGSYLKKEGIRLNARSGQYHKQSKFEGSYRQLRGAVVRTLLQKPATIEELTNITDRKRSDVARVLVNLSKEGLVVVKRHKFSIAK
jgi:A/G-specific adenine glycosylase